MCPIRIRRLSDALVFLLHLWRAAIVAGLMLAIIGPAARADDSTKFKINRSVTISGTGDAHVKLEAKMSAESYTTAKTNNLSTVVLLRRLGTGTDWTKLENIKGRFDDDASTFVIEYTHVGLARLTSDDLWEIDFAADTKHELLATFDTMAILTTTRHTDLGEAAVTVRIEIPKTGKDLRLLHSPERVTYRFAPPSTTGTGPQATFALDARGQLMSMLARPYSDSRFGDLWAARSVFKNTGDQTLSDYRVHYRVAGFSNWSEWKKARRVLPGQTVVDPYFPVLDLEKLGQLASSRSVMLEVEYEYRQQDGRTARENDSRQIQLLGRNQVAFSSIPADEAVGFLDKHNNAPAIIAALVDGDDSVMQEVAGRLNQLAGVSLATQKEEDARKFVNNLYAFLGNNSIGLQATLAQEVKFGRDVIRTRSGTCVDLAVLFASVCEAAGLQPVLYLTSDNCLVTVKLPGGQTMTLDVTKSGTVTSAKAQEEGAKLLREARAKGLLYEIDIARWRSQGVRSIDLPPIEAGLLTSKYKFAEGEQTTTAAATTTVKADKDKLAGRWTFQETPDGRTVNYTLTISADGSYTYRAVVTTNGKVTADAKEEGTFEQTDSQLKFVPTGNKQTNIYTYRLRGDELSLQLQGSSKLVAFQRAK